MYTLYDLETEMFVGNHYKAFTKDYNKAIYYNTYELAKQEFDKLGPMWRPHAQIISKEYIEKLLLLLLLLK